MSASLGPTPHHELTDPAYWDGVWAEPASDEQLSPLDPQFGRDGAFMRMIRRHVRDLAGQRVLEVGAGANYRLLALRRWAGAHVTGVDYSGVGLEVLTSPRNWSRHVLHDAAAVLRACAAAGLEFEREFHFGGVALQMAAWERPGLVPALLGFGQRVVRYASRRRFGIALDSRRLSQHRGVLARRRSP